MTNYLLEKINIKIDNQSQIFNAGTTVKQILQEMGYSDKNIVAARMNGGEIVDLQSIATIDTEIQALRVDDPAGLQVFWHSSSHIMAQAIKSLFPDAQLGIGPSIQTGFYYDFKISRTLSSEDFPAIEKKMKEIVEKDQAFVRKVITKKKAIDLFKQRKESFKVELLQEIEGDEVSVYQNDDFIDLCRGPHVPSSGYIQHFTLLNVAGAYWHGDERNPVLQRIYGVSFPDKKALRLHLQKLEEARNRDHRKLAKELDLFSFQPEGPGFPFWHSNGMLLYNTIMDFMRTLLSKRGYQEIKTPLILNEDLWHRSGHWDHYKENMYFTQIEESEYAVKPMNCPGCLLIYRNQPHSYRDLPLKLSEMGLVHRHEKSGVLHGLFRVRQFTQDDAHVFCTPDQMEDEVIHLIDLVDEVYRTFGFENYQLELSTRPAKSIGTTEMWNLAETILRNALKRKRISFQLNPGEGAFYGPKIDYHIEDSLGRLWQCGTIQVDFSMPERFELEYTGPDGMKHRPVMIHRAILGSVERFIGIMIEHYGGAFPLWLSPAQCIVIPISEKHHAYAEDVFRKIKDFDIRVKLDNRNEKVGYKIRESEKQKIPYMLIIGDNESEKGLVSVRRRKVGDLGEKKLEMVISEIMDQIKRRIDY